MRTPTATVDENLKEWATPRQCEYIDAINETGSIRAASRKLDCAYSAIHNGLEVLKRKAARAGYSPEHDLVHPVAPGQILKGASTLYKNGKPVIQWVKTSADAEAMQQIMEASVRVMVEDVRGIAPLSARPSHVLPDLLAVYPFGDPHVGLHAWAKECGADFDLAIGKRITLAAVDRLLESTPAAETAILLLLGDVFHMNDQTNTTPGHKNQLDVDSRYVKVLEVGIATYRHAVIRALEKHDKVIVKMIPGNHDPQAIWALAFTIAAYFDKESRVTVDLGPSKFWFYKFGKVLIGSTHGDTVKHDQLAGIMAADRPEDWGTTKHRYWYTGHVHSQNVKEFPGVVCESFRTLAAKDSYAAGYGYRAGRDMLAIIHHKEHGEVERHRVDIGMIE